MPACCRAGQVGVCPSLAVYPLREPAIHLHMACTSCSHCFELYGYDIMIDQDLKPILIEVNAQPSLSFDTKADRDLKYQVVDDALTLVDMEGEGMCRCTCCHDRRPNVHALHPQESSGRGLARSGRRATGATTSSATRARGSARIPTSPASWGCTGKVPRAGASS